MNADVGTAVLREIAKGINEWAVRNQEGALQNSRRAADQLRFAQLLYDVARLINAGQVRAEQVPDILNMARRNIFLGNEIDRLREVFGLDATKDAEFKTTSSFGGFVSMVVIGQGGSGSGQPFGSGGAGGPAAIDPPERGFGPRQETE